MKHLAALAVLSMAGFSLAAEPVNLPPALPPPGAPGCAGPGFAGPAIWADPQPPVPRGSWWTGATVPYNHQRVVYYPSFDLPVHDTFGWAVPGVPAPEVPQGAIPTWWKRFGQ